MVKIEKLSDGAVVTAVRDGKTVKLFKGQLITKAEADTMIVEKGTVVYTIDEQEIVEKSAEQKPVEKAVQKAPVIVKPAIKQPAAKTATK